MNPQPAQAQTQTNPSNMQSFYEQAADLNARLDRLYELLLQEREQEASKSSKPEKIGARR